MNLRRPLGAVTAGLLMVLMTACGGGGDDDDVPLLTNTTSLDAFVASYNSGLGTLASTQGLTDANFVDLFDERYLDAGQSKQQVRASLSEEADALSKGVGLPAATFPKATLGNAAVSSCDEATRICTLTATVVNADAVETRATITTQLRFSDGKFRLYGDQQLASS